MSIADKIPASISKTALDSLDAKLSAIEAGWLRENSVRASDDDSTRSDPIHVYTELLRRLHDGLEPGYPKRRQSPLVNAGYAARISVMTYILERWINEVVATWAEYSINSNDVGRSNNELGDVRCLNVLVIGCGMDALGIWSKHLLQSLLRNVLPASDANGIETSSLPRIKVYEFDVWDNCALKKKALLRSGLINLSSGVNKDKMTDDEVNIHNTYHIHARGQLNLDSSESTNEEFEYTLVSTDLRKVDRTLVEMKQQKSVLSHAGLKAGLDSSQPTIILSELVLTYLGYEGANAVIYSISNDLLSGNKLSTFVCLEPMFPGGNEHDYTSSGIISVQKSYAKDYSRQFLAKLHTGHSNSTTKANVESHDSSWLHPLGSNRHTLRLRLEACGISCFSIVTLGESAIHVARILRGRDMASTPNSQINEIRPRFMCAKEPFDEHAALLLNLDSYCVVCAFHQSSACRQLNDSGNTFRKWMNNICPWSIQLVDGIAVQIRPISTSAEDAQVNGLYTSLYVNLYKKYPAIQKMVNSALKGDLSVEKPSDKCFGEDSVSVIRDRFLQEGGDFWIATPNTRPSSNVAMAQSDTVVVGCIGVKRRGIKTGCYDDDGPNLTEFEIHRVAVDDAYRGSGIGKKLIEIAETSLMAESSRTSRMITLYAVTPTCLAAACKLYESCGYRANNLKSFNAGTLRMKVYSKSLGNDLTRRTCSRPK